MWENGSGLFLQTQCFPSRCGTAIKKARSMSWRALNSNPARIQQSPSCLRQLNGDIYIICPAEVSAACLRMPSWPYSQHKAQIFTDVEERAAAQRGVSELQLTGDGFMEEKNSTTAMSFFFSVNTAIRMKESNMRMCNVGFKDCEFIMKW